MASNYTETDGTGTPCSIGDVDRVMADGGTAGSSEFTFDIGSGAGQKAVTFQDTPGASVTWASGNWTIRINVTTAAKNSTWNDVRVRRYNSSCVFQEDLVVAALTVDTSTTGVKSTVQSGSAATPSAGDILVVRCLFNSTSHSETLGITPSEDIDSPFTAGDETLAVDAGSYSVTGVIAAGITKTPAAAGSYSVTGSTAGVEALTMPGVAGSYSVTGAATVAQIVAPSDAGAYSLTGSAATLIYSIIMAADTGSYSVSGLAAVGIVALPATAGSYSVSGTAAAGILGVPVDTGSYAVSGTAANLLAGYLEPAAAGSYTVSGAAASLLAAYVEAALAGSYTVSGASAAGILTVPVDAGSYAVSGADATLIFTTTGETLVVDAGSYAITGTSAWFSYATNPPGNSALTSSGEGSASMDISGGAALTDTGGGAE
jgi:hypothetical protein